MSAPPAASAHQENRREKGHIKQNRSKELPTPTIAFELKFPHFLNVVKAPFPIFFAFGRKNPLRSQYFKKIKNGPDPVEAKANKFWLFEAGSSVRFAHFYPSSPRDGVTGELSACSAGPPPASGFFLTLP